MIFSGLMSGIAWFTLRAEGDLPAKVRLQQGGMAAVRPSTLPTEVASACANALRPGGAKVTGAATADDVRLLAARQLAVPVAGVEKSQLYDSFSDGRGRRKHEAIDIHAPRGTPVIAAGDGCVVKLFRSIPGGITVYQFDPEGNFAYYYAHLERYADDLKVGSQLQRGDVLGFVGSTGNAPAHAPHLHFAIFRLGPEKRWWKGTVVNPYAVFTYRGK